MVEKVVSVLYFVLMLNIGVFNVGNVGGVWFGGFVLEYGFVFDVLLWVVVVVMFVVLIVMWFVMWFDVCGLVCGVVLVV